MSIKKLKVRTSLFFLFAGSVVIAICISVPAWAGSAMIGSVAATKNASVGGLPLLPNAVIFSGDSLAVRDGAAAIALSAGSRLMFGRDTEASFLREGNEVNVLLEQGSVALFSPEAGAVVRVKVNSLSIVPARGFITLGVVAMLNGGLVVTSKEGILRVEGNGAPVEVAKGRTVTILAKTERGSQGAPAGASAGAGQTGSNATKIISLTAVGVGTLGTVVGFVGISRANDATSTANSATSAANSAISSAAAASQAAAAAAQAAQTATALAAAVQAATLLEVNVIGCELNALANSEGKPSPYKPPSNLKCP